MANAAGPSRLVDRVRRALRARHYSPRTEQAYVRWIVRFVVHHGKRHPRELGAAEVTAFLTHLATERKVSASTQSQALSALLFLYSQVLGKDLERMDGLVRARRPHRLPVVLTQGEVDRVLATLPANQRIAWMLRYVEGHTVRDVSRLCSCSLTTIKRRLRAAQAKVLAAIDEEVIRGAW